jgi:mannose-6-phosphate isomerase
VDPDAKGPSPAEPPRADRPVDPVLCLETPVQRYAWGSPTAIPRLLGVAPDGGPQAELWIGAHPQAPARVASSGAPLDGVIADAPVAILGPRVAARFGALPFLLKYLAAAEPLSVQCHPDAAQAQAGFQREEAAGLPRNHPGRAYRDANPKPELLVARGTFEALEGFRSPQEILQNLQRLGAPELRPLLDTLAGAGLAPFYRQLMGSEATARVTWAHAAARAARRALDPATRWVSALAERYPDDVGVLAPLVLNLVVLEKDEALYLGAGRLHAYLGGEGVELMASSDNVVRGGLTAKHVDVQELLRIVDFTPHPPDVRRPTVASPGVLRYTTPAEHFSLALLRPAGGRADLPADDGPRVLLGLEGSLQITSEGAPPLTLASGRGVLLTPAAGAISAHGAGEAAIAAVPRPAP